jgi:toxin ParE1/3/4
MPRLVYLTSALRDLAKIAADIEHASQSRSVAIGFTDKLTDYCEQIASLPGVLGRPRQELRAGYRSLAFGNFVIFFRYLDGAVPREALEIIHVVYGPRDLEAFFRGAHGET